MEMQDKALETPTIASNRNISNAIAYGVSIMAVIIVLAVLVAGYSQNPTSTTGNIISENLDSDNKIATSSGEPGELQIVKLSARGSNYILTPDTVKKGVPVRIEADLANLPGCSRSIVIPSFNVQTSFNSKNNYLEFTPDKAGTFNIACSMNMYTGKFSVLESDGSKSDYAEKAAPKTGGCGSGCGMANGGSCGGH